MPRQKKGDALPTAAIDGDVDGSRGRANDPERTKADILAVATHEFSEKGLSGARIDEIAERTHTSKRMIYYYYGGKEALYRAVLEACYRRIRSVEEKVDLKKKPPLDALADLVEFTFDHHNQNPDFIRLVMVENIHHGANIASLPSDVNESAIAKLSDICARGVAEGVIRRDIDPLDLHMSISALCFFNVSNRHTFSSIFKVDMTSPAATGKRRENVKDLILRFVAP
ncbi:MAG TPA: TetR/AcrR family transcriptional regulator [Allosphingosinicella sp.]